MGPGAADEAAHDHDHAGQRENATQTCSRSVHQRSLPNAFNQAWDRSMSQRLPAWIGAGTP
jgi:hypothetical protein